MGRWAPDARGRLERAALELFAEKGFAATTVPEIAERAGLTTRTFFRHFADKREVIFAGDEIPRTARDYLETAPADLAPMALILDGLSQVATERFAGRRKEITAIRRMILAEEQLRERDARKRADLTSAVRDGFIRRGTPHPEAALLAETAVALWHAALDEWLSREDETPLAAVIAECYARLRHAVLEVGPGAVAGNALEPPTAPPGRRRRRRPAPDSAA